MDNNEIEEKGLTLQDIIAICLKHLIAIIIFVFIGTAGGFAFGEYKNIKSPTYEVSSSLLISDTENTTSQSDVQTYQLANYLTSTIKVFLVEDVVLEKAVSELKNEYPDITIKKLKEDITVSSTSNSLILDVTYADSNIARAVRVLNCTLKTAVEVANQEVDGKPKYRLLSENLAVLTEATEARATKKSSLIKFTLIGFAGGVVLAFVYVLLRELLDNKFKSTEDVEKTLKIPVLAEVARYDFTKNETTGGKK